MTGTTISHYRIVSELGKGGMGVVYRAEDTKLDRTVALKLLAPHMLASEADRARFYREARAAAALHHPNIATVFEIDETEDGRPFIAMEFIEGAQLDEGLSDKPLPVERAVAIASQIAEALKAAHERGIVHRDIKSANVMLTKDGTAKVLDFGLAKTDASTKLTQMGSTVGTIAYMSPEQARGEEVDHRTDLWSLGAVLYEMLTGQLPFPGAYEQAVVYGILNGEPKPVTGLRSGVPMDLERVILKLLTKQTSDRYQSAVDVLVDLRRVAGATTSAAAVSSRRHSVSPPPPARKPPGSRTWLLGAALLLTGLATGFLVASLLRPNPPEAALTRVEIDLGEIRSIVFPVLSPTGEYLAFRSDDSGSAEGIYLRDMSTGSVRLLDGSDVVGTRELKFSPSGDRLAYTAGFNGGVYVSVIPSGLPSLVVDFGRLAYWEDESTIVFSDDAPGGGDSYRLDLETGTQDVITIDNPLLEDGYGNVLKTSVPGTSLAFGHQINRRENGGMAGRGRLFSLDTDSGTLRIIESNAINPEYVQGGYLTYQLGDDDGKLLVRRVDDQSGAFVAPPKDALPTGEIPGWSRYVVTPAGDLLYLGSGEASGDSPRRVWYAHFEEASIEQISLRLPSATIPDAVSLAPDGERVYVQTAQGDNALGGDVYGYDLDSEIQFQYTFGGQYFMPRTSRDGRWVYLSSSQLPESFNLTTWRIPADRSAALELAFDSLALPDVSRDGRLLAGTNWFNDLGGYDIAVVNIADDSRHIVDSEAETDMIGPVFSPDGRYLAYTQYEAGQGRAIVSAVDGTERFEIPAVNAKLPRWSEDGTQLYYLGSLGVYRLRVRTDPAFNTVGEPVLALHAPAASSFDIHDNGSVIVVSAVSAAFESDRDIRPRLVWLQNWAEHLD